MLNVFEVSELRKPGTFAGNDAMVAFARLHRVSIIVHQLDSALLSIEGCEGPCPELHLTYHHGEHYSSIRKLGDRSSLPARIKFKPLVGCVVMNLYEPQG